MDVAMNSEMASNSGTRKYKIEDFELLNLLGQGSFGSVFLTKLIATEEHLALKVIRKKKFLINGSVDHLFWEGRILSLTHHPFVCHLIAEFTSQDYLFYMIEFISGGSLGFHLEKWGLLDETRTQFYAAELISGLLYLHDKRVVHRDLNANNVLVDSCGHLRICDFGLSKFVSELSDVDFKTRCGTPTYMAPEVVNMKPYDESVDWWSLGVLLYTMLVGRHPFNALRKAELYRLIITTCPYFPKWLSTEADSFLHDLLVKEPKERLGSPEFRLPDIRGHPFLLGIEWNKIERKEVVPHFIPNLDHPLDLKYFKRFYTKQKASLSLVPNKFGPEQQLLHPRY